MEIYVQKIIDDIFALMSKYNLDRFLLYGDVIVI